MGDSSFSATRPTDSGATPPAQNLTEPLGLYTLPAFAPLADSDQRRDDADIVAAWLTRLGNPGVG
jgi:hypothetical protein